MMKVANKKLPKLSKIELGLVSGIALVVGVMIYLTFITHGPAIRLTLASTAIHNQQKSSFSMKLYAIFCCKLFA
jgi:hypothetical protein